MKKEIYLVTGAAGFLGSNICRMLSAGGKRVRALVLNGDPAEKYMSEGIEISLAKLLHPDIIRQYHIFRKIRNGSI